MSATAVVRARVKAPEFEMPANVDAERSILGSILLENSIFNDAAVAVDVNDFSLDSHRRIFAAIAELASEGRKIDVITLAEVLGPDTRSVGGVAYLSSLTDGMPRRSNIDGYTQIVKAKSQLRRIVHMANAAINKALDQEHPADVTSWMEEQILRITSDSMTDEPKRLAEYSEKVFADLKERIHRKGEIVGMPYGISDLDAFTTGMRPKEVTVVGGRPGSGKSALGLQFAIENVTEEIPNPVYYASCEMSGESLFERALARTARVNNFKIRSGVMEIFDMQQLADAKPKLERYPLFVDDCRHTLFSRVIARAKLMIRRHGVKICVFDYAQIFKAPGLTKLDRVSYVSEAVTDLAHSENVHCVLLAQIKRAERKFRTARPVIDDLKETGKMEEDADVAILVHRGSGKQEHEDELIVAKQRNGPTGEAKVCFDEVTLRFLERT